MSHAQTYLPHGRREWMLLAFSAFLLAVVVRMVVRSVPAESTGGCRPDCLVLAFPGAPIRHRAHRRRAGRDRRLPGVLRGDPSGRLAKQTRYLVTNKRVLIQRGREELHLGRDKIVDVIDAPAGDGVSHVFLVLDGPRARALAASGAFGEGRHGPELRPVLGVGRGRQKASAASCARRIGKPPRAA
jgi:hypothetical protein